MSKIPAAYIQAAVKAALELPPLHNRSGLSGKTVQAAKEGDDDAKARLDALGEALLGEHDEVKEVVDSILASPLAQEAGSSADAEGVTPGEMVERFKGIVVVTRQARATAEFKEDDDVSVVASTVEILEVICEFFGQSGTTSLHTADKERYHFFLVGPVFPLYVKDDYRMVIEALKTIEKSGFVPSDSQKKKKSMAVADEHKAEGST